DAAPAKRKRSRTKRRAASTSAKASGRGARRRTTTKSPRKPAAKKAERTDQETTEAPEAPARDGEPTPASSIPPLPDEADEIVPYEEDVAAPARKAPQGASPVRILESVQAGQLHVSALNELSDEQVTDLALELGVKAQPGERRTEILYRLLQARATEKQAASRFAEGLLELHPDGYGFLRRPENDFAQHPGDVYVSASLIRKLRLKPGCWISGTARRARPSEPFLALQHVDEVNHEDPSRLEELTSFEDLTVVYPDHRLVLEVAPEDIEMRVIDLFCPLGRGQRALVVAPPRTGKTILLQKLADAVAHNSPNVDIVVLLVDERPEEVTNMRRSVRGEVIASTFDKPASNHVRVAELVIEKVKRMVEFGRHVVLLLDSITRLGRSYNNQSGPSGRILTGGLDAKALTKPKRFFSAARNVEDGGSLTIVATALVDTGSRLDDVIFEEFKGTGNMEIVLDRGMANARVWPAINLPASGTRNEDLLLHPEELRRINLLRKGMSGIDPATVMDGIRDTMKQYRTNAELLMSLG
ncbi:MAG: transcription termination factor Rho, partial [Planctomycetota bacterium]